MSGFDQRATTLDLNGPTLSWLSEPTGVTTCGLGTFVGIATATFPVGLAASYATLTGSLSYQWWYEHPEGRDGRKQGKVTNGTMSGLGLTGITGAATTTLTVYGNSTTFELNGTTETIEGIKFFLRPDYVPSAYSSSGAVTAGTARSTGNAVNENVISSTARPAGHPPVYTVDSNKVDLTIHPNIQITTQPSTQTIPSTNAPTLSGTATFNVVGIVTGYGPQTLSYQWTANGGDLSNGNTSYTREIAIDPYNIDVPGWSGAGIYYMSTGWNTGTWRTVNFTVTEESGIFHRINIEGVGLFAENNQTTNTTVAGGKMYRCTTQSDGPANLHIGGNTPAGGGNQRLVIEEGGDDWNDMVLDCGSGYFAYHSTRPQISSGAVYDNRTFTDRVSGAQTPELKMSTSTAGIQTVNCRITHPTACNSPLYSNTVNLNVISSRQIINYELLTGEGHATWYGGGEHNIFDSAIRFEADKAVLARTLVVYAPEQDIVAKVTLAAGAGRSHGGTNSVGGQGGLSTFYVTLKQNYEYVIKLGSSTQPSGGHGGGGGAAYMYKGGTVIAVVGGGGGAGKGAHGGRGGGVGLAGEKGPGQTGGVAGRRYADGQLPLKGFFAGGGWLPPIDYSSGSPGRLSACTFGQYWTGQGYSACQDMGTVRWRASNGRRTDESTSDIIRGYKSGLGHRNNGGNTSFGVGGGGGGAAGGGGAQADHNGGGGGSGYNSGNVEVITTQLGGNTSQDGYVIFEV